MCARQIRVHLCTYNDQQREALGHHQVVHRWGWNSNHAIGRTESDHLKLWGTPKIQEWGLGRLTLEKPKNSSKCNFLSKTLICSSYPNILTHSQSNTRVEWIGRDFKTEYLSLSSLERRVIGSSGPLFALTFFLGPDLVGSYGVAIATDAVSGGDRKGCFGWEMIMRWWKWQD